MNRYLIPVLLPAAALPLLVDASLKGGALLVLAVLCACAMRGASAAARHMVWLSAMIALLLLPLLAGLLPGWRVLPEWATVKHVSEKEEPVKMVSAAPMPVVRETPVESHSEPITTAPAEFPAPGPLAPAGGLQAASTPPAVPTPAVAVVPAATPFNAGWVGTVWLAGCAVLLLRLTAAHWLLRRAARRCEVVTAGPLAEALREAQKECGVRQPVRLLLDEQRTIPVVWGIFRPQLLLPADAGEWDAAQLRSVLLHELAHIRRRDTAVQALTGVACALHWFNPLVWFAAWRLHMERERACDDLVLARGVRPSEYAGHLLHVAAEHTAARWTAVCGLAMARKSSLEGRLLAVLSEKLNRRGLTHAITIAAVVLSAVIAVPVAMLRAQAPATPAPEGSPDKSEDTRSKEVPVPVTVTKLKAGLEEKLQWGETVNGLRAALVRPAALDEPPVHEAFDFKLVVQNVSDAPISVSSTGATANTRYVKLWDSRGILSMHHDKEAPPVAFTLQPGEVATMRLFKHVTDADSITGNSDVTFVAEFKIERPVSEKEGTWSGNLITAKTAGMATGHGLLPKNKEAKELFKIWAGAARRDEKIPGALIGLLAEGITKFTDYNPDWPTTPQLLKLRTRCDATHDWSGLDAIALLDEIAAVQASPIGMAMEAGRTGIIRAGKPLPKEFAKAPWGEPRPNGLRLAWLFEPLGEEYPLGTPVPARVLIHNSGKEAVVFRAHSWNQPFHHATDASGAEVKSMALEYMTLSSLITFRLAPGEYVEVNAPGIGVGPQKTITAKEGVRVGTYFEVKEGDTMTVTTEPLPLQDGNGKAEPEAGAAELWWLEFIRARLSRDLPLPADTKERELILYRAAIDLFGTPVSAEINAAFAANQTPSALDALTRLLAARPGQTPFAGNLQSGATTFKVNAAATETDDSKKKERTVSTDAADAPHAAAAAPAPAPAAPAAPKRTAAYPLFKEWQRLARVNGKIPGALIGELKQSVEIFVKGNPTWPTTPKLLEKLPLLDASHDWDPASAAQLVDEIMSIQEVSGFVDGRRVERGVRTGTPLPPELASAPWGEAPPTGLRVAWMVGEGATEYRLGTPLKSRVLVHNAGKQTIVFRTHTWRQSSGTARDAKGAEIPVSGISWMTRPPLVMFRLAPGEYIELTAPGIGVGKDAGKSEWADVRVGTIIEAKEGDEVTFTPGLIPLTTQTGERGLDGEPRWRQDFILDRLRRELPLPAEAAERRHLLDRAVREIFGTAPTEEETAAFIADTKPTALESLAERLAKRPNVFSYSGALASAATKFRVLAADPDAAKKPRVVLGPGEYPLSDKARLVIVGRPVGDRRTNDAVIRFSASPDETAPRADYKLNVPDGYGTWAIVCRPGTGVFWLLAQSGTLKVLYNDPAGVQLFAAKPGSAEAVPEEFRVETQRIMTLLDVPVEDVATLTASAAAQDDPDFKKGESLYAAGSMEEAIAAYQESLKKLPAGRNRIMALFHMGEAHRSLAAKAGTTEERRTEHLRLAEECDRAVMAGSTISSGPGKFGRFEPCETAVCFISWRRAEASYKEAQTGGNLKKYDEAIGDFLLAWEIARNPASELGGKNVEMTAGALYHVAKCHALQGDKVRAKDSFQQVLQVEGEQAKAWQEKAREELKVLDSTGPATPKKVADTPTPPASNQADPKPEKTHLFNDKYSAIAVQSGKEVHFVIAYAGMLSSGMSEWTTGDGSWGFEGQVHLVDVEKTKRLGKNADKRVLSLKYTSAAPDTLLLDGKAYELRRPLPQGNSTGMRQLPGRIILLRDSGEPLQTDRTLPLRDEKDLVTIGDFAVNDALMMETYANSRRVLALSGWVIAWDSQQSIQHGDGERVAMLRVFADGRVLWLPDGRKLTERKISPKEVQALLGWLAGEGGIGEWKPEMVKTSTGERERDPVKNMWDRETDVLFFTLDGKRHGLAVESGGAESETARRIWTHLREQMEQAKEVAFREWSAPFQSLAKLVAESRGLTDWSMDDLVAWGPEKDGLRAGVLMPARGYLNKSVPVQLVLRNVSSETKELRLCTSLNVLEPVVRAGEGMPFMKVHKVKLRGGDAVVPVTLKPGAQYEFAGPPVQFGISKDADGKPQAPEWPVCGVDTGTGQVRVKFPLGNVPGPETGEVMVEIGAAEK